MRILVTGGAGYIGSLTARHLAEAGHVAVVLDDLRNGHRAAIGSLPLVVGDVRDTDLVAATIEQTRDRRRHPFRSAQVGRGLGHRSRARTSTTTSAARSASCARWRAPASAGSSSRRRARCTARRSRLPVDRDCADPADEPVRRDARRSPSVCCRGSSRRTASGRRRCATSTPRVPRRTGRAARTGRARRTSSRSCCARPPGSSRSCASSEPTTRRPTARRSATTSTCSTWPRHTAARSRRSTARDAVADRQRRDRGRGVRPEVLDAARRITGRDDPRRGGAPARGRPVGDLGRYPPGRGGARLARDALARRHRAARRGAGTRAIRTATATDARSTARVEAAG